MSVRLHLLTALAVVVALVCPVAAPIAVADAHDAEVDLAFVDRLLFDTSMKDFRKAATSGDSWFDWSSDGCSAPLVGNTGRSFNFSGPCERHDFGYRNLQLLESRYGVDDWNHDARKQVDKQFRDDMRSHCHSRSVLLRPTCYAWSETFYRAVRLAGVI